MRCTRTPTIPTRTHNPVFITDERSSCFNFHCFFLTPLSPHSTPFLSPPPCLFFFHFFFLHILEKQLHYPLHLAVVFLAIVRTFTHRASGRIMFCVCSILLFPCTRLLCQSPHAPSCPSFLYPAVCVLHTPLFFLLSSRRSCLCSLFVWVMGLLLSPAIPYYPYAICNDNA